MQSRESFSQCMRERLTLPRPKISEAFSVRDPHLPRSIACSIHELLESCRYDAISSLICRRSGRHGFTRESSHLRRLTIVDGLWNVQFITNTFTVTDPTLVPLGAAVSPVVALINHSCDPNAVVVFPRVFSDPKNNEPLMHVVAIRDIQPEEELCP